MYNKGELEKDSAVSKKLDASFLCGFIIRHVIIT